jgi:hypothetical protein
LLGFDKAMITSGGISLKEVDSKTMKSKIINNLYFAGEVLDIDGPSGGYNLQVCWTTGYVAALIQQKMIKYIYSFFLFLYLSSNYSTSLVNTFFVIIFAFCLLLFNLFKPQKIVYHKLVFYFYFLFCYLVYFQKTSF